jgi:UrcA family protein
MSRIFFASVALAALVAPAFAASVTIQGMTPTLGGDRVTKRTVLKYDDLDPAKDAAALYDRINRVAAALCASNPGGSGPLLSDKVESCRVQTVRQAVRDVGSEPLETVAAAKRKN